MFVFLCVWISCLYSSPLFLLGCLCFAYYVRSSLSLEGISAFPVINVVSVVSQPDICVWNLFMVSFPTSYVLERASFTVLCLGFCLESLFPSQVQTICATIFPQASIDSLRPEFRSIWHLSLCVLWGRMPIYGVQDSHLFSKLFLKFLCCFVAAVISSSINLGAILCLPHEVGELVCKLVRKILLGFWLLLHWIILLMTGCT